MSSRGAEEHQVKVPGDQTLSSKKQREEQVRVNSSHKLTHEQARNQ